MRSERGAALRRACVAGLLSLAASASAEVVERILAVVDGRPLMLSEVRALATVQGRALAEALEALIDERLMFQEAARLPGSAVSEAEEQSLYAELAARLPKAAVPEADLRRLVRRQAAIVKYVEFRFRPHVRVEEQELRDAFAKQHGGGEQADAFAAAAPELRRRLAQRALDARIEEWVKELRESASIRYVTAPARAPR
jgi:hypothetical protein